MINDWMAVAGKRQINGFYIMTYMNKDVRVRAAAENPNSPDSYEPVHKDANPIRSDTEYAPVKSLRDSQ